MVDLYGLKICILYMESLRTARTIQRDPDIKHKILNVDSENFPISFAEFNRTLNPFTGLASLISNRNKT